MSVLPHKTKQIFFVLIKLSLVIAAFYFIYFKLSNNNTLPFSDFLELASKNDVFSIAHLVFLILLSTGNWCFEILKWQTLVKPLKQISFFEATEQSLGSLMVSLFTPNRIGEYGAKALFYNKTQIKHIVPINGLHNLLQLSVSFIFGSIGLLCFISIHSTHLNYTKPILGAVLCIGFIVLAYFALSKIRLKQSTSWLNKLLHFVKTYPKKPVILGLNFSIIRYLLFSFQFYYLLNIFGVDIVYLNAMIIISTMYLLASVIPSLAIFDFVIKGSFGVYLFSFLNIEAITIIQITTIMWIFNFALPSLIGSYFVLTFKWPKPQISK